MINSDANMTCSRKSLHLPPLVIMFVVAVFTFSFDNFMICSLSSSSKNNSNIVTIKADTYNNATEGEATNVSTIADNVTNEATEEAPTEANPPLEYPTEQDEKCKHMFEWSMIHDWDEKNGLPDTIDYDDLPQKRTLSIARMGGPSATGTMTMSIEVHHDRRHFDHNHHQYDEEEGSSSNSTISTASSTNITVVDIRNVVKFKDPNLWHRMAKQYQAWTGLQIAEKRYNLTSNQTIYLCNCDNDNQNNKDSNNGGLDYLPAEWKKIGTTSCDTSLLTKADVTITPPSNGLLWDLAWDTEFTCHNSDMFKTFASLFVEKYKPFSPMVGCFVDRQDRPIRSINNYDETIELMHQVFPRVRIIHLTNDHSNDEAIDLLYECKVLFGSHGAGFMNSIFARPGIAVVEMIGKNKPAYFRNINMLLGQHYDWIYGDRNHGMHDNWDVDLDEARDALEKAKEFVTRWLIEHDGQWRRKTRRRTMRMRGARM